MDGRAATKCAAPPLPSARVGAETCQCSRSGHVARQGSDRSNATFVFAVLSLQALSTLRVCAPTRRSSSRRCSETSRCRAAPRRAAPRRATTRIASISHVRLTHSIHSPIYTPRAAIRYAAQHVMELKLLCFGPSGDEDDDDDDDEMPLCLRGSATLHTEAADSPGSRTRLLKVSAPAEDPAHAHAWVLGDGGVLTTRWPAQVADAMEDEEWRAALITALNHRRCASPSPWRSLPPWRNPRQAVRGRVLGGLSLVL